MSTVDPADAKRSLRRQRNGDQRYLAGAIACAAGLVAGAFLLGLAFAETAEMMRHSIIDSTFDDRDPYPLYWGVGTFSYLWIGGISGVIAGGSTATWLLDQYRGGERQPRTLAVLGVCTVAIAVVANSMTWLEPLAVGTSVDPVFHEDTAWGAPAWIAYYADLWFPALAIAVAGLVALHAVRHHRRLRHQIADRDRLLAQGRRTRGAVTGAAFRTTTNDQGQRSTVGVEVTVTFTDDREVRRWVSRFAHGRKAMPVTGFAEVLFDPDRPGADELIFVALDPDPSPPEWIGPEI
jgi:hypothetical protein